MPKLYFDRPPTVENASKINVSSLVRKNVLDLANVFKQIHHADIDLNQEESLQKFIELVEKVINLISGDTHNQDTEQNSIRLTYTKSNIGKGFIIWFVCNHCTRRTRHLYIPPNSAKLLCRKCHRLRYKTQYTSKSELIKILQRIHEFEKAKSALSLLVH